MAETKLLKLLIGLLLAFGSGICYSICSLIVKHMKGTYPGQLAVYRSFGILTFSVPQMVHSQENPFGPRDFRFLLLLRGFFGATNLYLSFLAFRYLPLGEAAVIIFSVPVIVTIMARVFLKEPCGICQTVVSCLTVIGIFLITKVPQKLAAGERLNYSWENLYGLAAALGSLLFSASRFIILRKVKSVHHAVVTFNYGLVAVTETTILTFAMGGAFTWMSCGEDKYLIIILGILSYTGQTMLTIAAKSELAGPVSTTRAASDVILSFIWQVFLFGDDADAFVIIGAVLVSFSIVVVGIQKYLTSLPEQSPSKRRMSFLIK